MPERNRGYLRKQRLRNIERRKKINKSTRTYVSWI